MGDPLVKIEIDQVQRVAILTWSREPRDFGEWHEQFESVLSAAEFKPTFGIISDWRRLVEAPTNNFVEEFLRSLEQARHAGRFVGRWATIVSRDHPAVFGVGRMTETRAELKNLEYRVFRDELTAILWASASI